MVAASISANGNIFTVQGALVPSSNQAYNLGSPDAKWKDLYLSGSAIHLGSVKLEATQDGELLIRTNDGNPTQVVKAVSSMTVTATSNVVTNRLSPFSGNVIDVSGATLSNLTMTGAVITNVVTSKVEPFSDNQIDMSGATVCNLSLVTNNIEAASGGVINMGGSTLSNLSVVGLPVPSRTSNVYFYAGRGGQDFTLPAGSTIGDWSDGLTTQTPAGIFDMNAGVFTAPVSGTYILSFGFRCSGNGELRLRINGTDMQNFFSNTHGIYGSVIHRLTAGTVVQLVVMEAARTFHPDSRNNRLWFQGTLTYME